MRYGILAERFHMITVSNSSFDPFYNQALEEYLFQNVSDDVFYLWQNDPAVIVGSYQNICREVHAARLRKLGIPVIRRISGGGTVYHDRGNINYTLILHCDRRPEYDEVLKPIIQALCDIGVPAHKSNICDIAIEAQKISGSAQRAEGGKLLHHGTLLFQSDLSVLNHITTHRKNDSFHSKGTESSICTVTNIREHLQEPMTIDAFKAALSDRVLSDYPAPVRTMTLAADEKTEIQRLADEKYRSWDWTWGRTPFFSYEKEGLFLGEPIRIAYQAKHGIISDAHLSCKKLDCTRGEQLLNGSRLDPDGFAAICSALTGEEPDALMDLML